MRSRSLALLAGVALVALIPGAATAARPDPVYRWVIVDEVSTECDAYHVVGELQWVGTRVDGTQAVYGTFDDWGEIDEVSDVVLTQWRHATRRGSEEFTARGAFPSASNIGASIQPMVRGKIRTSAVFVEFPACT